MAILSKSAKVLISPLRSRGLFAAGIQFWFFHISGVLSVLATHFIYFWLIGPKELLGADIVAQSIWVPCFLLSGLILRRRYIDNGWQNQNISNVLVKGFSICALMSLAITIILSLLFLPLFLDEIMAHKRVESAGLSTTEFIASFFFGNWVQLFFYLVAWLGLYIGITNNRRAKAAEVDNLRLQNSLKEARLSSLSNQLNPHFLFNALNNIRFMIQENGDRAEEMIMSLSEVLRYSLESSKQGKLPLVQELGIIERYIDLVKIQFEDRLEYKLEVDSTLNHNLVPPMVLQMLVENAVKHGIEQIPDGGVIDVSCFESGGRLMLSVCNDVPKLKSKNTSDTGIGLKNIEQRLRILYADAASLKYGMIDDRFCVSVDLPIE